jgi:hypothetical protein
VPVNRCNSGLNWRRPSAHYVASRSLGRRGRVAFCGKYDSNGIGRIGAITADWAELEQGDEIITVGRVIADGAGCIRTAEDLVPFHYSHRRVSFADVLEYFKLDFKRQHGRRCPQERLARIRPLRQWKG